MIKTGKYIGLIAILCLFAYGCETVTQSDSSSTDAISSSKIGSQNVGSTTVLVTEDNVGVDWATNIVGANSALEFSTDVGAPAGLGSISLKFVTENDNSARAEIGTAVNVPLSDIGSLDYWTYQPSANPGVAGVAYKMYVTFDAGWTYLVFEPYWQNGAGDPAPIVADEWQNWENMESGNWWSSRTSGGLTAGAGGPPFYSIADVLTLQPNAVVQGIQLGIGSYNPNWSVFADGMTFNDTTYDFDVIPNPETKDDCKNGGWAEYGFTNQGQCIRFVNTGKDSRE